MISSLRGVPAAPAGKIDLGIGGVRSDVATLDTSILGTLVYPGAGYIRALRLPGALGYTRAPKTHTYNTPQIVAINTIPYVTQECFRARSRASGPDSGWIPPYVTQ